MYEMYPQAWASGDPGPTAPAPTPASASASVQPRPRRRPRKDHPVLPPVLLRHLEAERFRSGR